MNIYNNKRDVQEKDVQTKGSFQLTIIYLNRKGWFCNSCKQELTRDGLVTENIESGPANETQIPIHTREPTPNDQTHARRLIIGNQEIIR